MTAAMAAGGGEFRHPTIWWAIGFGGVVLLVVLELMPSPPSLDVGPNGWADHALAYATLMAWFARLDPTRLFRARIAFALVAIGVVLECVQGLTTWRTFDVTDMMANAIGVAIGWLASPPRLPNGLPAFDRVLFDRGR